MIYINNRAYPEIYAGGLFMVDISLINSEVKFSFRITMYCVLDILLVIEGF